MEHFNNWEDFMNGCEKELISTELLFSSIHKGRMSYRGDFNGHRVYCEISESFVSDYSYCNKEPISELTQAGHVYLKVGEFVVMQTK